MFHNLAVPVLHLFIWIVKFLSLYVDELNDDDDDDDSVVLTLKVEGGGAGESQSVPAVRLQVPLLGTDSVSESARCAGKSSWPGAADDWPRWRQ